MYQGATVAVSHQHCLRVPVNTAGCATERTNEGLSDPMERVAGGGGARGAGLVGLAAPQTGGRLER